MGLLGLEWHRALAATVLFGHIFAGEAMSSPSNITIDDNSADPVTGVQIIYGPNSPNATWNLGQDCATCVARPDPSQAFDGSWHDGTFFPGGPVLSASVSFTGTAVYVMSIMVSTVSVAHIAPLSGSDLMFQINGTDMKTSNTTAPIGLQTEYAYGTPVFVQEDLPLGQHELTILNGGGSSASLFLLDRIIYTTNTDEPPNTPASSGGAPEAPQPSPITSASVNPLSSPSSSENASKTLNASPTHSQSTQSSGSAMTTSSSSPSETSQAKSASKSSRSLHIAVALVASVLLVVAIAVAIYVWLRRRARTLAAALSTTPFEVEDVGLYTEDGDPPDYTTVIAEFTQADVIDVTPAHPTPFLQAGTKLEISRIIAASVTPNRDDLVTRRFRR